MESTLADNSNKTGHDSSEAQDVERKLYGAKRTDDSIEKR